MQSVSFETSMVCGLAEAAEKEFDNAYIRFVERHFRHMESWFAGFRHIREQDREDAVQDFFLSIRRKIRTPRSREVMRSFISDPVGGKAKFRKWLWRIAKHSSVDFIRSRKHRLGSQARDGLAEDAQFSKLLCEQIELLFREDYEAMLQDIAKRVIGVSAGKSGSVSALDWQIFVLSYRCSKEDLAERFAKSSRAIEQSIYRARKGLREIQREVNDLYGITGRFAIKED